MKTLLCVAAVLAATCGVASAQSANSVTSVPVLPQNLNASLNNVISQVQQQAASGGPVTSPLPRNDVVTIQPYPYSLFAPYLP